MIAFIQFLKVRFRIILADGWITAVGSLFFLIILSFPNDKTYAQAATFSGWGEPLNLSMTAASSGSATIVADHSGVVHVFWNEDLGGSPHPVDAAPSEGNAIIHRQLHSGRWTEPVDIVFAGDDGRISGHPSVIVDNENYLNMLWVENFGMLYSRAPAWNAATANAWSTPEETIPFLPEGRRTIKKISA